MPKYSIIVPIYNVESYLPQCIDSIRSQTYGDFEIVCVIDGSTDRSEAIVRMFARVDERIRIIAKENGGLSSARNAGISVAKGEYLLFVDSDDLLERNALATVDAALQKHQDTQVVTFGAEVYPPFYGDFWLDEVLSPEEAWYGEFDISLLLEENSHPFAWRTAVSRKLLEDVGLYFDETVLFGEDEVFHFQLYPQARGVYLIPDKLYRYRVLRRNSLMATRSLDVENKMREHIIIVRRIIESWEALGIFDAYRRELFNFVITFLLDDFALHSNAENDLAVLLSDLLRGYFTPEDIATIDGTPLCKEMVGYLVTNEFDSASVRFEDLKARYLAGRNLSREHVDPRPGWKQRLRSVFPMTAKGLDDRLDEIERLLDSERMRWYAEDTAACAKSLELLRLELSFKEGI